MDNDNGDYLAPTNSELLALNNTNKPSIFGLVSQLAKNVEKKSRPENSGWLQILQTGSNWIPFPLQGISGG